MADSLDTTNEADAAVVVRLREVLGGLFADKVAQDADWAREVVGMLGTPP